MQVLCIMQRNNSNSNSFKLEYMGCNTCGSKSIQQKTEIIFNGSLLKDIKLKNLIQTKDGAIIKQTPIVKKDDIQRT